MHFALPLAFLILAGFTSAAPAGYFPPSPDPNGEPSLKQILDSTYGAGHWSQLNGATVWNSVSPGVASYQLIAAYSADVHQFGYSTTTGGSPNSSNFTSLFSVSGSVYSRTVSPSGFGSFSITAGSPFVFVLNNVTTGNYFSSNDLQNLGIDPMNPDHVLAFSVQGEPNTYVLAFEDLTIGEKSDIDYNDLVVQVSMKPVPEPASLVLIGLGAGTCAIYGWRSRRKTVR
jgi:hypothetical protein